MASRSRISRGRATQRLVAEWFQAHGWPFATSRGASEPGTDLLHTEPLAIEVKATSAGDLRAALRQAQKNAGKELIPIVIWRPNGVGEAHIGEWVVAMYLQDADVLFTALRGY